MNTADILILLIVAACVTLAVLHIIKEHRKGGGCCGDCSGCIGCSRK